MCTVKVNDNNRGSIRGKLEVCVCYGIIYGGKVVFAELCAVGADSLFGGRAISLVHARSDRM